MRIRAEFDLAPRPSHLPMWTAADADSFVEDFQEFLGTDGAYVTVEVVEG